MRTQAESRSKHRHRHARACSHTGWLACKSCLQHPGKWRKRQSIGGGTAAWSSRTRPLAVWPAVAWIDLEQGTGLQAAWLTVDWLCVAGIGVRRNRQIDAPVALSRASGSVPWGRGGRCTERERVFPDHISGAILQPDRLLQACLHTSVALYLYPSFILFILVFVLLSPSSVCSHFPSLMFLLSSKLPLPPSFDTTVILLSPSRQYSHLHRLNFLLLFVK